MKILKIIFFILFAIITCNYVEAQGISSPTIANGEDWSLPGFVDYSSRGGNGYQRYQMSSHPSYIRYQIDTLYWSDLNPSEGVYDWSTVNDAINNAITHNAKLILRIKCSVVWRSDGAGPLPYVPAWVTNKHHPNNFTIADPSGSDPGIVVVAPWDSGVQTEYSNFINAFCAQNFLANTNIAGIYLHGISSSPGEEFWIDSPFINNAEAAGMNSTTLYDAFTKRIRWWANAAGEYKYKLGWVHAGWIEGYDSTTEAIDSYAIDQGVGMRRGNLERYHQHYPPEEGLSWDSDSHMVVDWNYPLRVGKRYYGNEIEVESVMNGYSSEDQTYFVECMVVRGAQLGLKYFWTSSSMVSHAPDAFNWFAHVAGLLPGESPDALCWLREGYLEDDSHQNRTWKNFSFLLEQKDYSGANTVRTIYKDRYNFYMDQSGIHYDYTARRTDVSSGNNSMLFFFKS